MRVSARVRVCVCGGGGGGGGGDASNCVRRGPGATASAAPCTQPTQLLLLLPSSIEHAAPAAAVATAAPQFQCYCARNWFYLQACRVTYEHATTFPFTCTLSQVRLLLLPCWRLHCYCHAPPRPARSARCARLLQPLPPWPPPALPVGDCCWGGGPGSCWAAVLPAAPAAHMGAGGRPGMHQTKPSPPPTPRPPNPNPPPGTGALGPCRSYAPPPPHTHTHTPLRRL